MAALVKAATSWNSAAVGPEATTYQAHRPGNRHHDHAPTMHPPGCLELQSRRSLPDDCTGEVQRCQRRSAFNHPPRVNGACYTGSRQETYGIVTYGMVTFGTVG